MNARKFVTTVLCIGLLCGGVVYSEWMSDKASSVVLANETTKESVIRDVLSYVTEERADDPLMEIEADIWVKTSNVEGIKIDGETYYYSLLPHMSFDPFARGKVSDSDIAIVYEETATDYPVMIYQIHGNNVK